MISLAGIESGYGRIRVLNGIDLTLEPGSFTGVLGHNGMGKSTLLKTIVGAVPTTTGTITVGGRDVTRLPPHARARLGIGYVPQGRQIFPGLTVAENLRLGAVAAGRDERVVERVLADFPELPRLLDRPGGALSGGEQQLLALARALCGEPSMILLDEPTEGIQPSIRDAMTLRLQGLRRQQRLTLLLVEQNLDFIRALSDRVLLIQRGRIVRELTPAELARPDLLAEFTGIVH